MKTIIALAIIGYAIAAQGTPPAASFCMGNVDDLATCSACYNQGVGTTGARQLATNSCATAVANTVTNCLWYSGLITATKNEKDCGQCNSKTWMNVSTFAPLTIACDATASSTTCATAVLNCDQSYCLKTTATVYASGCRQCSSTYLGAGTLTAIGYPTCTNTGAITNCSIHAAIDKTNCYICLANFAVASTGLTCSAWTTDVNCRMLASAGTYCKECKNNYYFTLASCTLGYDSAAAAAATGANLMAVSAFLAALLVFFN